MKAVKTFHTVIPMNNVFSFPQKTQQKLINHEINPRRPSKFFKQGNCVLRDSVLPAFVFKILWHFCPLLRVLMFPIFAAFSAIHTKVWANKNDLKNVIGRN